MLNNIGSTMELHCTAGRSPLFLNNVPSICNTLVPSIVSKATPRSRNTIISLHWRSNDHDGVSNHQPHGCLLNRLFSGRSKKTSKLRVTGLCVGNSPGPVNSPHKGPVTRKMFPFGDVIMKTISTKILEIIMIIISCNAVKLLSVCWPKHLMKAVVQPNETFRTA